MAYAQEKKVIFFLPTIELLLQVGIWWQFIVYMGNYSKTDSDIL